MDTQFSNEETHHGSDRVSKTKDEGKEIRYALFYKQKGNAYPVLGLALINQSKKKKMYKEPLIWKGKEATLKIETFIPMSI